MRFRWTPWRLTALLALLAPAMTMTTVAATTTDTCPGFLLSDKRSVVASTRCVSSEFLSPQSADIARLESQPHSVVLIGANHAPVVLIAASFEQHSLVSGEATSPEYLESSSSASSHAMAGTLQNSSGSPVASLSAAARTTSEDATNDVVSPIVFGAVPGPAEEGDRQRILRYDLVRQSSNVGDATRARVSGIEITSGAVTLEQSRVAIVASSECVVAASEQLTLQQPHQQWFTGALCGTTTWPSANACAVAHESLDAGQLVTVEQGGVEYAFGFAVESFGCVSSSSLSSNTSRGNASAGLTSSSLFVIAPVENLLRGTWPPVSLVASVL